ncbi:MAG: lipocalin family protein [Sphingobacteriales bacterium]|nr:lipocalin family protein [Sphingobacteriales bacterium]
MKKNLSIKSSLLILAAVFISGCLPTNLTPITTTPTTIDLSRYTGKWYEIASLPQIFSLGAKCITAEYSSNPDGSIKVLNKQVGADGRPSQIEGRATVEANSGNTKLKVAFFGAEPANSNYWIVEIADDYSYAVVSDPTKTTFWILSRTPQMDETLVQDIINRWAAFGINTALIKRTVQDCW